MQWRSALVWTMICALLQGALLASLPLVRCIGANGHQAIEACVQPACHGSQREREVAGLETGSTGAVHALPCIDGKVTDDGLLAADGIAPLAGPALVAIPAPRVVITGPLANARGVAPLIGIESPPQVLRSSQPLVLRI